MFLFIKDYSLQLNINDSFIAHKNRRKEEAIFNFVGKLVVSLNLLLPDAFMKLSSEFLMNYTRYKDVVFINQCKRNLYNVMAYENQL